MSFALNILPSQNTRPFTVDCQIQQQGKITEGAKALMARQLRRGDRIEWPLPVFGTKRTWCDVRSESAFGSRAEVAFEGRQVRFGPNPDIGDLPDRLGAACCLPA